MAAKSIFYLLSMAVAAVVLLTAWVVQAGRAHDVSPLRWFTCFALSAGISVYGYARKSLDAPAFALALFVGYTTCLASGCFGAIVIAFFISSSRLTKWKRAVKETFEPDTEVARDWKQVFCNGFTATLASLLFIYISGPVELPLVIIRPLDVILFPIPALDWPTLCSLACLGGVACCCGDTWASEIGSVLGHNPRLLTSLRPVPRGTNGGVSIPGLVASTLGGLLVGVVYYVTQLALISNNKYSYFALMTAQWIVIPLGAMGGLIGSLVDSLLGATLQYSGFNEATGKISHSPGSDIKHISGLNILSNNQVNLLSSIITAIIIPILACRNGVLITIVSIIDYYD